MDQKPETFGENNDLLRAFDTAAQAALEAPALRPHISKPLTPEQGLIIYNTRFRLVGHTDSGEVLPDGNAILHDIDALTAMNNSQVINTDHLQKALSKEALTNGAAARRSQVLCDMAKEGWQAYDIQRETLQEVFRCGGYAFLLEYHDNEGNVTPYGFQMGFPSMPKYEQFPLLSVHTLPEIYEQQEDTTFMIWRSGIIKSVNDVREDYARLQIPVSPDLEGQELHHMGAGLATKYVDGVAAEQLGKEMIMCNVSTIARPGNMKDAVASNEASFGSLSHVCESLPGIRLRPTDLVATDGTKIAQLIWHLRGNSPTELLQRARDPKSPIVKKKWPQNTLEDFGMQLGSTLSPELKHWEQIAITIGYCLHPDPKPLPA